MVVIKILAYIVVFLAILIAGLIYISRKAINARKQFSSSLRCAGMTPDDVEQENVEWEKEWLRPRWAAALAIAITATVLVYLVW